MNIENYMVNIGRQARAASRVVATASTADKNAVLETIADSMEKQKSTLLKANGEDMAQGKRDGLDEALLDRLELNDARVCAMADGLRQIAILADPIGEISQLSARPSGIRVGKMRVPLGVVGIIYESRPNVTADAAGLCLKSGNATILRGGSEAIRSNKAIAACIHSALDAHGLPKDAVQVIETTDRAAVVHLVKMKQFVDVIVPRGGKGLIAMVSEEARVPVIKHLHGVCHVFVDDKANFDQAISIAYNAKTQRYGTCNTMETLLVHGAVANDVLAKLGPMFHEKGVELRGCPRTRDILPNITAATDEDWAAEYLAPILSVRVVDDLSAAIEHIQNYGSGHTDAIVTEDYTRAMRFLREVDSSSVMVNASTRFADGYEYGLGAEIGISTDKIHARGPVGLEGLTSQKYIVLGEGHVRS